MSITAFRAVAEQSIDALCAEYPEQATLLGEHRYDDRLGYPTASAARRRRDQLQTFLDELAAVDAAGLDTADRVDAEILRTALQRELLMVGEIDEASWNPMLHNPGEAVYGLLARDFAPLPDRLVALTARLRSVPDYLDAARERLTDPTRVHTETAVGQLGGTVALLDSIAGQAGTAAPPGLAEATEQARTAILAYRDWLSSRLGAAERSPRLGAKLFARKLGLTLATPWRPELLLAQAYDDLARVENELTELVGADPADPRPAIAAEFDRLAADTADSATILQRCREALAETRAFVADRDLLTLLDDPVEVIEMPEIDRGVSVAYCRGVGALETAPLSTQFAVSPTPADWDAARVRSFYREYNNHMLHNLTVHEAMPGHVEQLSHARRYRGNTAVRAVHDSGSFIEGWAVYAEELMVSTGYRRDHSAAAAAAVRMQQLKMQLRMILNTVFDISYHCGDLDERSAMELMTVRGYQEDGEAAGKWRRVQLSSTQLSTYYVGYLEVRGLVADLRRARPTAGLREIHDTVLAHGCPPVRQLRTLLELPPAGVGRDAAG